MRLFNSFNTVSYCLLANSFVGERMLRLTFALVFHLAIKEAEFTEIDVLLV